MHDLLRLYAAELGEEESRRAAVRRLTDFHLHTGRSAAGLLRPERPVLDLAPADGCVPLVFEHRAEATAWFADEHAGLLALLAAAVAQGRHRDVWQLARVLSDYHVARGLLVEDLTAWEAGVAAAGELAEPPTEAHARVYLGTACARVGRPADAVDHLHRALELARASGANDVLADVHRTLGWVWGECGDNERALPHAHRSLALYRAGGNELREADALNSVGWLHAQLGNLRHAADHCERALALSRRLGHRRAEAVTLHSLGYIAQRLGRPEEALRWYEDALAVVRDSRDVYDEADIQLNLGEVHRELGHHGEARRAWEKALELCVAQHRPAMATNLRRQLEAGKPLPVRS
jgi:tetratricopeptide (TPR) repeat protein